MDIGHIIWVSLFLFIMAVLIVCLGVSVYWRKALDSVALAIILATVPIAIITVCICLYIELLN